MRVRNNRVTDSSFCQDIEKQLERIRKYLSEKEKEEDRENKKIVCIKGKTDKTKEGRKAELAQNYQNISPQERQEGINSLRQVREAIQSKIQEKVVETDGR